MRSACAPISSPGDPVRTLDRKLVRDLRLMWSQALTIALIVASGIGGLITTLSAVDSLAHARDQAYLQGRFADVFATVKRAPDALTRRLREVAGVADVETTIEQTVRVEIPGLDDPIIGLLVGVAENAPRRMNRVFVRSGRSLDDLAHQGGGRAVIDVLISEGFAQARGLRPGAELSGLINGKRRTLRVTGTALSPEHIFAGLGGVPDIRGFAVLWLPRTALAAAYDMDGAFNRIAIKLAPGASARAVGAAVERIIAPYGGRESYPRADQPSHRMLDNEIKEQHVLGSVLTTIFVAVSAFLLNVVVTRLVSTQREQIATLKAVGYGNLAIGLHYLKLVAVIVLLGWLIGIALGKLFGQMLVGLYAEFFRFPVFEHRIAPWLIVLGLGVALLTAALGAFNAIAATVRLAPAEAMRPPAPGRYRPTLAEALAAWLNIDRLSPALRMILRNMERRPLRTALSVGGVAVGVGLVIMGNFVRDSMDTIVDSTFRVAMRSDVIVWMNEPVSDVARHELARLPGAIAIESGRDVTVRFVNGHRSERGAIQGYASVPELRRIVDIDNRVQMPAATGLVMTDRLARKLGLEAGDAVRVEVLEGRQATLTIPVTRLIPEMMGLNAYIERRALNRLLHEDDVSSQYAVAVERGSEGRLLRATKALPRVVGAFSKATLWRNMQQIAARNIHIMSMTLTLLATIIAVGVVYNNTRIALSERTWELASLRVLGFTRTEVSALLLGEMALSIALALPLGMLLGNALVHLLIGLLASDQFQFPIEILPRTYAWAALTIVAAGIASALVVRRRIDRLDMVAALKTRE
jgi:putative ABC transport system permease protein